MRLLRRMVDDAKMPDIKPETMFQDMFGGRMGISMQSTAQLARYNREIGGRFRLVCGAIRSRLRTRGCPPAATSR